MCKTRPDISAAVAYMQTQQANPRMIDWQDVQHILGYLRGTGNMGILYNPKSLQPFQLTDVALAIHYDRKSHTGSKITLGEDGPVVEWLSSKQTTVALSSTDAETIGLSDKADRLLLCKERLTFLGFPPELPMTICQDNTSTITMAYMGRPSANARRRYIDIRYFWIKQYLDNNTFKLVYCPSALMYADVLASIRSGADFSAFVRRVLTPGPLPRPDGSP
jgi:hypothetical protein